MIIVINHDLVGSSISCAMLLHVVPSFVQLLNCIHRLIINMILRNIKDYKKQYLFNFSRALLNFFPYYQSSTNDNYFVIYLKIVY